MTTDILSIVVIVLLIIYAIWSKYTINKLEGQIDMAKQNLEFCQKIIDGIMAQDHRADCEEESD